MVRKISCSGQLCHQFLLRVVSSPSENRLVTLEDAHAKIFKHKRPFLLFIGPSTLYLDGHPFLSFKSPWTYWWMSLLRVIWCKLEENPFASPSAALDGPPSAHLIANALRSTPPRGNLVFVKMAQIGARRPLSPERKGSLSRPARRERPHLPAAVGILSGVLFFHRWRAINRP